MYSLFATAVFFISILQWSGPSMAGAVDTKSADVRAEAVRNAFRHAWSGYAGFAFGHDELLPLTNETSDSRNGWGASIFDALDTMIIMGLDREYETALEHVAHTNWHSTKVPSKTFETNIRYLGGLLSAYDLRPDPNLLRMAVELADTVILPAYRTPNGIPAAYVNVAKGMPTKDTGLILAEFGSLQLELVRLSQLTGNATYGKIANNVIHTIAQIPTSYPGLYPIIWDLETFTPSSSYITISGGGDSYYEYLLKTHLLMDGNESRQLSMWKEAAASMAKYLRSETGDGLVFLSDINDDYRLLRTGELVCFMPANLLLGGRFLKDAGIEEFAEELMQSCYDTWAITPTGIAPETWSWIDKHQNSSHFPVSMQSAMKTVGYIAEDLSYDLRPETIESLFYFYRITGDSKYQDMAWEIFQSVEKYCKTFSGYTRIANVFNADAVEPLDFQESYFFAETLKYLYLIFSDPSMISLDEYVFNTEAHPFRLNTPINVQAAF